MSDVSEKGIKAIAAYIRVSTTDQADQWGPTVQRERIEGYIRSLSKEALAARGINASRVEWYEDAMTGKAEHRPQLDRLKQDVADGRIGMVVSLDISRIGRDLRNTLNLEDFLRKAGCSLACVNQSFDTATPMGRMVMQILGTFAEYERSMIVERTVAAKKASRAEGGAWGGKAPFGFRYAETGGLVPNEDELVALKRIMKLKAQGLSPRSIARQMTEEGFTGRSGNPFSYITVYKTLARTAQVDLKVAQ